MKLDYLNNITLDALTNSVISFMVGLSIGVLFTANCNKKESSHVENNDDKIDSLTTVNDNIKLKVEHLDSIKNAKVIEVSILNNDSTLKLFYELVSE